MHVRLSVATVRVARLVALFALILAFGDAMLTADDAPAIAPAAPDQAQPTLYPHAAVAAASPYAVEAGLNALRRGGNAADAAVATALALGVVEPFGSGLGGGGFLLYYDAASGKTTFVEYRETAPIALDTMTAELAADPEAVVTKFGGRSIGVPGTLRGLLAAHERWGTMDFAALLDDPIRYAEEGFAIPPYLASVIAEKTAIIGANAAMAAVYLDADGKPWREGDRLVQRDLGATLRAIQAGGESAVYGPTAAERIAAAVREAGGFMVADDIADYRPRVREAARGSYRGYDVLTVAPPSAGGSTLLMSLAILDRFDIASLGAGSPEHLALMAEAFGAAYRETSVRVADPAMADVPLERLLSPAWTDATVAAMSATARAAGRATGGAPKPGVGTNSGSDNTTHFSIVDEAGNVVALTQTINYHFGSGVMVPGTGIVLNNELDDFTRTPGAANFPAGGKIPRSNMTPTILLRDGRPVATIGCPGSQRIPTAIAQILVNTIDFGMSLETAIAAPRLHYPVGDNSLRFESLIDEATMREAARLMGTAEHATPEALAPNSDYFGGAQAVWIHRADDGTLLGLEGAADPRRDGTADGF